MTTVARRDAARANRRRRLEAVAPRPALEGPPRRLLLLLFLVSGVSGLIYQVIWVRQLTLVFGATSPAITTVLAVFMLGLALGSYGAGRWAHRWGDPLRAYGVVELAIAVCAAALPFLLDLLTLVHVPLFRRLMDAPVGLEAMRVLLVAVLLLPPTILMGASLPLLARAMACDAEKLGRDAGMLYGINTLGAAGGVYLATFFLIPSVGLTGGWLTAAGLNVLVGSVAWVGARRWPSSFDAHGNAEAARTAPAGWAVLVAYGCSGLAALGYEVIWTRLLILLFGSSVYAFAVMLAAFLLGLGLGALVGSWLAIRVQNPALVAAALQVIIALSVLADAPWFDRLPALFLGAFRLTGGTWWALTILEFLIAMGLMIVPTTAMGATFSFVARLLGAERRAERTVGNAYATNTWGAIVGAAAAGFLLIPWLGFRGSLVALACANTLAACLLLAGAGASPASRWRWTLAMPPVALAVAVALLPGWNPKAMASGVYVYADRYGAGGFERTLDQQRVLFYREGATATVAVIEGRYRFLRINGKTDAGDSPDNLTQRLLAHVPMLLHPEPHSVLIVGLGTGITLGTALLHPIDHVDTVEISPEVIEASHFFSTANGRALEDRRTRLRVLDARTWLLAATTSYDVIVSEPSNPWQTGNSTLFTLEHYRLTRARLKPGGTFCQWLPFYRMDEADFKAALRTFQAVFPEMSVWFSGGDVLLVGNTSPLVVDLGNFLTRAADPGVARTLREIGISDGSALLGFFMLDHEHAREYAGVDPPFHSDVYPLLEFSAPKTLYRESAPQILSNLRRLAGGSSLSFTGAVGSKLAGIHESIAGEKLRLRMPEAALASLADAERAGRSAAALRSLRGHAWNDIAVTRAREGDHLAAAAAFDRALLFTADDAQIHLSSGLLALHAFADYERAERHFREAVRLRPGYSDALLPLAALLARQGRWAEAEAAWRQVLTLAPDNQPAREGLAAAQRVRAARP